MGNLNCWEFMKCGREPGGTKANELGVCIACSEARVDGMHGGKNGGRVCWAIAGTFCLGKAQCSFLKRMENCFECSFYIMVKSEMELDFKKTSDIYNRLKKEP